MTTNDQQWVYNLLVLIEDYAEARHRHGHSSYNKNANEALQAVRDAIAAQQPKDFSDVIAMQREEAERDPSDAYMVGLYNGMTMMDANYKNSIDWRPMQAAKATLAAGQATAAAQGFRDGVASVSRLTDTQIASACMSYRHDFGLLDDAYKEQLAYEARSWEYVFAKERELAAADGESK